MGFVCHKVGIYAIHCYRGFLQPRIGHLWRSLSYQNIVRHMDSTLQMLEQDPILFVLYPSVKDLLDTALEHLLFPVHCQH